MSKEINFKGRVQTVTRADGKIEAKVTLTIPAKIAGEIPLGEVNVSIEALQGAMFETPSKQKVRGV